MNVRVLKMRPVLFVAAVLALFGAVLAYQPATSQQQPPPTNATLQLNGTYSATTTSSDAIYGVTSDYAVGIYGNNTATGGTGSQIGIGVYGQTSTTNGAGGMFQNSVATGTGVQGTALNGVVGFCNNTNSTIKGEAVYGTNSGRTFNDAGLFNGTVEVNGTFSAATKNFKIDHPMDPTNKYLVHASIESDQMMNLYSGVVTLDSSGRAIVQMPRWFQALNRNFSYQLTPIGGPSRDLYISREIEDNYFEVAGGAPGMKVSWLVTGVRQDDYARAHPLVVEQDKPVYARGKYLYPVEAGKPASQGEEYKREQEALALSKYRPKPPVSQSPLSLQPGSSGTKAP